MQVARHRWSVPLAMLVGDERVGSASQPPPNPHRHTPTTRDPGEHDRRPHRVRPDEQDHPDAQHRHERDQPQKRVVIELIQRRPRGRVMATRRHRSTRRKAVGSRRPGTDSTAPPLSQRTRRVQRDPRQRVGAASAAGHRAAVRDRVARRGGGHAGRLAGPPVRARPSETERLREVSDQDTSRKPPQMQAKRADEAASFGRRAPALLPPLLPDLFRVAESTFGIPLTEIHASGHASSDDLKRFAAGVGAERIVPIHTAYREAFSQRLGCAAEPHGDGEWWTA